MAWKRTHRRWGLGSVVIVERKLYCDERRLPGPWGVMRWWQIGFVGVRLVAFLVAPVFEP